MTLVDGTSTARRIVDVCGRLWTVVSGILVYRLHNSDWSDPTEWNALDIIGLRWDILFLSGFAPSSGYRPVSVQCRRPQSLLPASQRAGNDFTGSVLLVFYHWHWHWDFIRPRAAAGT